MTTMAATRIATRAGTFEIHNGITAFQQYWSRRM